MEEATETVELSTFVKTRYRGTMDFEAAFKAYLELPNFKANENIHDILKGTGIEYNDDLHEIMRLATGFYMTKVLTALKIDTNDPNISEDRSVGNIGTAGRVAKLFTAANMKDTAELMSGRWNPKPRMASFPNDEKTEPVFVTTRLDAVCSHHFIRFGDEKSDPNSMVVVGYIPEKKLGGISKINRFVEWCSKRGWLQESLTDYIGKEVEKAFETSSVYVALLNHKHGCASTRGASDREASTSTFYKSGKFLEDPALIPSRFRG